VRLGLQTDPTWGGRQEAEVDWVYTACTLIRREVFEDIGLLDENMFFGGDDMEFCYRAARAGWKTVYLPQAEITHHGNRSGAQVFGDVHGLARARTRIEALDHFQRKHFSAAHSYVMRGMLGLGSFAISLLMRLVLLFDRENQGAATRAFHSWNTGVACLESMFGKGARGAAGS
jgi:GT2 family glycosyltransferase